jgi:hypothetical protein
MSIDTFHSSTAHEEELQQYRSISLLAVISALIGTLSVAALAYPGLWLVPAAGIVLGAVAVYVTSANADRLGGKYLAVAGLCLSIFFGAWAPTQFISTRHIIDDQSQEFCVAWLRMVLEKQLEPAHQAHLSFRYRQPEGTSLVEHYRLNDADRKDLEGFFNIGVLKDIRGAVPDTAIHHLLTRQIDLRRNVLEVIHSFELIDESNGSRPAIRVRMHVRREKHQGNVYWTLIGIADDSEFAPDE